MAALELRVSERLSYRPVGQQHIVGKPIACVKKSSRPVYSCNVPGCDSGRPAKWKNRLVRLRERFPHAFIVGRVYMNLDEQRSYLNPAHSREQMVAAGRNLAAYISKVVTQAGRPPPTLVASVSASPILTAARPTTAISAG